MKRNSSLGLLAFLLVASACSSATVPLSFGQADVFTVSLTLADPRELRTASQPTIDSSCMTDRPYSLPASAAGTLKLTAFKNANCTYTLKAGGRTVVLDQTQANAVTLKRLDVDDVVVTREDGTQYTASGLYDLYFGGQHVVGPNPTSTGVDLLPGTYEIETTYSAADGRKTQRNTLTL